MNTWENQELTMNIGSEYRSNAIFSKRMLVELSATVACMCYIYILNK